MEMHQIRYFLAVAQTRNFTRAAEDCHVAQPSLTRAIKLLELEFGSDLFRRERKLTHLTEFGQRMLPFLRQCYDSAATAKTLAKSMRTGAVAPLALALSHSIDLSIVMPALTELAAAFPGLELKFLRGAEADVAELLKKGDAELALAGAMEEQWDRLDAWPLFSEPMVALVGADNRLANRDSIDLVSLGRERLLARPYCESSARVAAFLRSGETATRKHELVCDADLLQMVEANLGVGIVPSSVGASSRAHRIPLQDMALERTVHLYCVAGRARSAAGAALIKLLRAHSWT